MSYEGGEGGQNLEKFRYVLYGRPLLDDPKIKVSNQPGKFQLDFILSQLEMKAENPLFSARSAFSAYFWRISAFYF